MVLATDMLPAMDTVRALIATGIGIIAVGAGTVKIGIGTAETGVMTVAGN
jgi:hypothetical protein